MKPTPLPWLPVLANIEPPALRHKAAVDKLLTKATTHETWGLHGDITNPPALRLSSRHPLWIDMEPQDITTRWREEWESALVVNHSLVSDPAIRQPGFALCQRQGCLLNRLRTGKASVDLASSDGGNPPVTSVTVARSRQCPTSSTPAL